MRGNGIYIIKLHSPCEKCTKRVDYTANENAVNCHNAEICKEWGEYELAKMLIHREHKIKSIDFQKNNERRARERRYERRERRKNAAE